VPTKTVLKMGFFERDFERDHLAEKSNRTKIGQKIHCAVAHFVPSRGTWYSVPSCQELQVKNCKSRIASQELQVKNCKSRIASQELQVKNSKKSLLDSLDIFFSRLNE
jgi:hypothetical protein